MFMWIGHFVVFAGAGYFARGPTRRQTASDPRAPAAAASVVEVEVVGRLLGRPYVFFDLRHKSAYLGIGGFAVAFCFACFLYFPDLHEVQAPQAARDEANRRYGEQLKAQQDEMERNGKLLAEQLRQRSAMCRRPPCRSNEAAAPVRRGSPRPPETGQALGPVRA